jgi:hypothetical protein
VKHGGSSGLKALHCRGRANIHSNEAVRCFIPHLASEMRGVARKKKEKKEKNFYRY